MEHECCARAQAPLLFGCFQRRRFYAQSRVRWAELARTAGAAVVMADFDDTYVPPEGPELVALPDGAVLPREWVLVCDAPDYSAYLAGWEIPGRPQTPERAFETVVSVDPQVVRTAARTCAGLSVTFGGSGGFDALNEPVREGSPDLRRAESVFDRMPDYLETDPGPRGRNAG